MKDLRPWRNFSEGAEGCGRLLEGRGRVQEDDRRHIVAGNVTVLVAPFPLTCVAEREWEHRRDVKKS